MLTGYTTPIEVQGYFNDDRIRTKSKALLGEMYYDLSDDTQVTVGIRYSDDSVKDSIFSCLTYTSCNNLSIASRQTSQYVFSPTQVIETDKYFLIYHRSSNNQLGNLMVRLDQKSM